MKKSITFFAGFVFIANFLPSTFSFAQVIAISAGGSHSLSLHSDNTVWAWGNNYSGQLGDGTTTNRTVPVHMNGLIGIIAFAGGQSNTLGLKNDGTVWAVGNNQYGQLGDSTTTNRTATVQVKYLTGIISIASGWSHSLALKNDSTVWAWGDSQDGQLGNGSIYTQSTTPVQVSGLTGIVGIAGGASHSLALKNDGTVWAWGHGGNGELGNGALYDQTTPVQVLNLTGITGIAAGDMHSLALKDDSTVWAWGNSSNGQLGDDTTISRDIAVQVRGAGNFGYLTGITAIAGGTAFSLALKKDSTVWAWGQNNVGQIGDSTSIDRHTPVEVHGPANFGFLTSIIAIAAGGQHVLTLKNDSSVWTWGYNGQGQLGDSTQINKSVPVQVDAQIGITTVTTNSLTLCPGSNANVSYTTKGAFVSGNIFTAQLSNASGSFASPANIGNFTSVSSGTITCTIPVASAAGTGYRIRVISSNPAILSNDNGTNIRIYSLPVITASTTATTVMWGTLVTLTASGASSYVWSDSITNGIAFYPSTNTYTVTGTDGNGCTNTVAITITVNPLPSSVAPRSIFAGEESSFSLCNDSTVRAWGRNDFGQLGDGSTTDRQIPVEVSGLTDVIAISQSKALKKDSTVWAWGLNKYGQLGDGTTIYSNTPIQVHGGGNVGFLTGIIAIAGCEDDFYGTGHSLALRNDGTVWAWGSNFNGELGTGDTIPRYTPVQVSGLTGIIAIAVGIYHSLALKNDGTVWAWGQGGSGEIGDSTLIDKFSPVQVHGTGNIGFLTGITAISAGLGVSFALKNDSTLWAWGDDQNLVLGDGNIINESTPVQVHGFGNAGFLTDIIAISGGFGHTHALKKDGTMWSWGAGQYGELGDGYTADRSTPVQVSGLTGIIAISGGYVNALALKDDGTIWAFGINGFGQIGDGTTTERHIPTQVVGPCMIPTTPVINLSVINTSSCSASDGSITANVLGNTSPYTYLWNNGQTTSTIIALTHGTYTLTTTDANSSIFTSVAIVDCATNTAELLQQDGLVVYPNPNNGIFSIKTKQKEYELIICNLLGEKILSQRNQNEKTEIDLSKESKGFYYIKIMGREQMYTQKIIIQ